MLGLKGFYVLSGKYSSAGKNFQPGEAMLLSGPCTFRLKELLDKYPELRKENGVSAAEAKQEKLIEKLLRKPKQ